MAASDTPQVRTLLLTDLVESTSLVERLGDVAAAALFRAHDRLVLELQQRWRGRLIDRSDGLLLIFARPIDGLGFALDYVRGLRDVGREHGLKQPLLARAGLHVGEVLLWENSLDAVQLGAKSLEVEGIAKPLAGRLMALARPGQILLSATAEPLAHRAARELGERGELLVWKSYGRWRFKGVPEAQEIHEVGEPGLAPLRMPAHTPKAWRDLPLWRRPVALAAEAMLVACIAVGGWFLTRPQPAIAFNERDWVVVGDLRNLTGDTRLDDSLEQAFRISLEQSRYVNVLSDLKVRETLERMQRKPGDRVDRALGSEIALRDGVRALLLPTVAEVGGRLRVSAEVVDPRTQTTVYSVSADGSGVESALASIDRVTGQLRNKLGEAMKEVQQRSVPLPNVATPNLDALRAYAVARKLSLDDRFKESLQAIDAALVLDPKFASAHAARGYVKAMLGDREASRASLEQAMALRQRMTPRERLHMEANWAMLYDSPGAGYRAWRSLHSIYPDHGSAAYMLAQLTVLEKRDYAGGLKLALEAARPYSTAASAAFYMQGLAQLGLGKLPEAEQSLARAANAGVNDVLTQAAMKAVQRDWVAADKWLLDGLEALSPAQRQQRLAMHAVTMLDRGDAPAAIAQMQRARSVDPDSPLPHLQQIVLAHAAGTDSGVTAKKLRDVVQLDALDTGERFSVQLVKAWLAADIKDMALLDQALGALAPARAVMVQDWPAQAILLQVIDARRMSLSGRSDEALKLLEPRLRDEDVHSAILIAALEAARLSGDAAQVRDLESRLSAAIGRAYADGIGDPPGSVLAAIWVTAARGAGKAGTQ